MMTVSIQEITKYINGELSEDSDSLISGVAPVETAGEGEISFISNPKYIKHLYETKATAIIIGNDIEVNETLKHPVLIRVQDPYIAFCMVLDKFFNPLVKKKGIEAPVFIAEDVSVPETAYVGAFSYLGKGVEIGEGVQIYPNVNIGEQVIIGNHTVIFPGVTIYSGCKIGENCIIHSGTVIGSDGFGHALMPDGTYAKIPQVGNVVIENNVEIGANCTIDRATLGSTIIRNGVKLDNLIQVAHNVEIGANTVIASQTGISGTTKLGANCVVGGQVGFAGHINIADKSRFGAQSGVPNSIKEAGKDWMGTPVVPLRDSLRNMAIMRNLSSLLNRISSLELIIKSKKNNNDTKTDNT